MIVFDCPFGNNLLSAEEEIRIVFKQVQKLLQDRYSSIYQDIPVLEE